MREALTGITLFCLGVFGGYIYGVAPPETREDLQREYDSMRLCMQTAGRTGCHMTIPDFIRYAELQELLEIPPAQ